MDWSMLIGPLFGWASTHIFRGSKNIFGFIDKAPAPLQQAGVLALSAGTIFASQWVPGLADIVAASDPNAAAGIAVATAYGLHRSGGSK